MRAVLLTMITTAIWAAPATAVAQLNAGGDQYTENVPTADGQTPSEEIDSDGGTSVSNGDDSAGSAVDPGVEAVSGDTTEDLVEKGPDGDAVARLSEAGAGGSSAPDGASPDDRQPISSASSSGPAGLGVGLPIFLVASLLIALVVRYARRGETS